MPAFSPVQLREWTSGTWFHGRPAEIGGFSIDSRKIRKGDLFIALRTEKRDGHDFLAAAKRGGACGALVSALREDVDLPQLRVEDTLAGLQKMAAGRRRDFSGPVIGITGSCGKTSTKELLALLLGRTGTHRTKANFNNRIGVPLTLLELDPSRHRYAVVEAGSNRPGEIELLARLIDSTQCLITGVAPAHLEHFGTVENIAREKAQLGRFTRSEGTVLFPRECSKYASFHDFSATAIILVPEELPASRPNPEQEVVYWTEKYDQLPLSGCRLTLRQPPFGERTFRVPVFSRGMAGNAALAIVMASLLGRSDGEIQKGLREWNPAPFRGEFRKIGNKLYYLDCYNANPASMVDSFSAFTRKVETETPRLFILGCMEELGERSPELHRWVGEALPLRPLDKVLLVGREAVYFREGLLRSGRLPEQVVLLDSLEEARKHLGGFEGAVLLKGSRAYALETLLPSGEGFNPGEREEAC